MDQLTVILDVTRLLRRSIKGKTLTGIDRVTMAYVRHYEHRAYAWIGWAGRSFILSRVQSEALFAWLLKPASKWVLRFIVLKGMVLKCFEQIPPHTFLLNTGHIGLGQSDYERMIRKLGVKPIFFVHDIIPIIYPEYCSPGEDSRHVTKMNYVLSFGAGVITNSQATLNDLTDYARQTHQMMPPAVVALLASGIPLLPPEAPLMDKPYFVILGTIEPRKNHVMVFQLWRRLVQHFGEKTPHLVVIGQRGWECENAVDMLERCQMLKGYVTEISRCNDADLVTYLHHSQALLMPSFVEGYGLPVVEALALGVPVIASDLPVFKEIACDIIDYLNPLDGMGWGDLIMEYARPDSSRRASQMKRLQQFKRPDWDVHFIQVDAFLGCIKH